jgi:hypothetical protein
VLARDADLLKLSDLYKAFAFDADTWGIDPAELALNLRQFANKENS